MTATAPFAGPDIAIVLPPRERFSPTSAGAVALVVHAATRAPSRYRRLVVGAACADPFDDVAFAGVTPRPGLTSRDRRYAAAVARAIGTPKLIEVHNRPQVALHLARLCPAARISLFLHNDPLTMRGLRTQADRSKVARHLAGIVCVSDYLARRLNDVSVQVIPNGIDLAQLPQPRIERDQLILFVGRMVADKGADAFVAACARALPDLPGWRAQMIGADRFNVDSPITPFITRLAPQAAAAGIELSGYHTHKTVLDALSRAAIVVVPSRWQEPFGMTALEAMASGAALICSNRGGLAEITGDAALPCDPDNPATIAAAIRHLAKRPTPTPQPYRFDIRTIAAQLDTYRAEVIRRS